MGKGIDLARLDSPEHAAMMDDLKDQLLLVLIRRLGGVIEIPCAELDDTGGIMLAMSVDRDTRDFHFEIVKKQ